MKNLIYVNERPPYSFEEYHQYILITDVKILLRIIEENFLR